MTGLILAGFAVHAAAADTISDIKYLADALSCQVSGHRCLGREQVNKVKLHTVTHTVKHTGTQQVINTVALHNMPIYIGYVLYRICFV